MPESQSEFVVTGFADEISPDLETQLDVLSEAEITHLDLRSVDGTNVLDLPDREVRDVRRTLDERGFQVSSIGSPIGKIDVTDDFRPHREKFERALELAATFDTEYVRLFSYYIPEGETHDAYREEVLRRMSEKTDLAAEADVTLLHENEKGIYGDTPAHCRDLLTAVDSPHLRAIFDPANFLELDVAPYPDALLQLVEFVDYLHIKDAVEGPGREHAPAGEGDSAIPELLAAMGARGFRGFASLEPHLSEAEEKGGFSGPDGFERAARALKDLIADLE